MFVPLLILAILTYWSSPPSNQCHACHRGHHAMSIKWEELPLSERKRYPQLQFVSLQNSKSRAQKKRIVTETRKDMEACFDSQINTSIADSSITSITICGHVSCCRERLDILNQSERDSTNKKCVLPIKHLMGTCSFWLGICFYSRISFGTRSALLNEG